MTAPHTDQLRDAAVSAICAHRGSYTWETIADLVLAVVQPELERLRAELEQARQQAETGRAAAFREAARLLEDTGRDDDAVNLLDVVADGIARAEPGCGCQSAVHPGHYPSCPGRAAQPTT